ncbi:DNA-binding transcriptional ArsR family regulator [Inhella inkyongensis]|uniref:DNA-binding transcriptional ArsR family regulator n=1 Tax=Inhella inkyongensis TaxID=392593 RepID=A0A840S2E0_9BURK|nr:metalloregulator ArsR/SmtB family transcription factor [Inhella inkyongensis]MBB5203578.1 DNA-binding transcriptional ArsR family regulator [Inhella inkyongensis]
MSPASEQLAQTFAECKPVFFALSEIARQQILLLLSEHEALNVNQIAEQLPLSRPAISHHLKILRDCGLVQVLPRGTENLHLLSATSAVELLARCAAELNALGPE